MQVVGDDGSGSLPDGSLALPPQWSTIAPEVDATFAVIFWFAVATALTIFVAMGWFAWRYRRSAVDRHHYGLRPHPTRLQLVWFALPLLFFGYVFREGLVTYSAMRTAPEGALEIRVRAMQWNWEFEHPGGVIDRLNVLRVPVDTPVHLIMSSSDVIHSFFVPAFRLKQDVVPGMYTTLWFQATQTTPDTACERDADCPEGLWCSRRARGQGERQCTIPIYCAEYCGAPQGITASAFREGGRNTHHATMMGDLVVVEDELYRRWWIGPPPLPDPCDGLEEGEHDACLGESLYDSFCVACHSVDGATRAPAPNWAGLFGRVRHFEDGTSAVADENYIRRSILQPQEQVVEGYGNINMPPFRLSDRQLDAIIAYIRSLD